MEEGVLRLEHFASALISEARRFIREGNREQALSSLHFAETFDPGRPQIHLARASAHWHLGGGFPAAASEGLLALKAAWTRGIQDLSLAHQLAFLGGIALAGALTIFACLMVVRYQVPFRHEVEEIVGRFADEGWSSVVGWAVLGFPLFVWFGTGWAILYWILITFRFMGRSERIAAVGLLVAAAAALPLYNVAVALYGTTADPAVRATIASADGEYAPDRIVRLRRLVEAHPDNPVYRFLLAGLYKNGRYFDEAFAEYKRTLALDPDLVSAYINLGNIFYTTGQHGEAISNYRHAIERDPEALLAWFNMHLAQSADFRFAEAEESLARARAFDFERVAAMLAASAEAGDRPPAPDAGLRISSVWESAVAGRQNLHFESERPAPDRVAAGRNFANPVTGISLGVLGLCGVFVALARRTARRCLRCGNPFCHHCKSSREGKEYCTQCLHLFVKGDGLAPGTKQRKMYEVDRYERRSRGLPRLLSLFVPGAGHVLRGRTGVGVAFLLLWLAALIALRPALLTHGGGLVGLDMIGGLLDGARQVPRLYNIQPLAMLALGLAPAVWLAANLPQWRRRRES